MMLMKKVLGVLAVLTLAVATLQRGVSAEANMIDFEDGKSGHIHMAENEGDPAILSVVDLEWLQDVKD